MENRANKHSPGPWQLKVAARDGHGRPVRTDVNSRNWEGLAVAFATRDGTAEEQEEAEANARLIAAAPELLEACQYVLRNWVGNVGCAFDVQPVVSAINKAIVGAGVRYAGSPAEPSGLKCVFIPDMDG